MTVLRNLQITDKSHKSLIRLVNRLKKDDSIKAKINNKNVVEALIIFAWDKYVDPFDTTYGDPRKLIYDRTDFIIKLLKIHNGILLKTQLNTNLLADHFAPQLSEALANKNELPNAEVLHKEVKQLRYNNSFLKSMVDDYINLTIVNSTKLFGNKDGWKLKKNSIVKEATEQVNKTS